MMFRLAVPDIADKELSGHADAKFILILRDETPVTSEDLQGRDG
jgi:hypothetical protein